MNKEVEKICKEIERIKKRIMDGWQSPEGHISSSSRGALEALNEVLSFLDTLEVKEVEEPSKDLEEEIDKELHENWYGEYIDLDKFREPAKYFFELGLKAKGE